MSVGSEAKDIWIRDAGGGERRGHGKGLEIWTVSLKEGAEIPWKSHSDTGGKWFEES